MNRFDRGMAGGLFQLQSERAPEISLSSMGQPSLICLNEYVWDKKVNGISSYEFLLYLPVIKLLSILAFVSLVVLIVEAIHKTVRTTVFKNT